MSVLCTLTNEGSEGTGTLRGAGTATQADREGSEKGTLSAAIVTGDKIDGAVQCHFQVMMTHEILELDALYPAILLLASPHSLHL